MASTKASTKKSKDMEHEMELKAEQDKAPLEDSFDYDLDIYGNQKHRFYNETLELKTRALREKFEVAYE